MKSEHHSPSNSHPFDLDSLLLSQIDLHSNIGIFYHVQGHEKFTVGERAGAGLQ